MDYWYIWIIDTYGLLIHGDCGIYINIIYDWIIWNGLAGLLYNHCITHSYQRTPLSTHSSINTLLSTHSYKHTSINNQRTWTYTYCTRTTYDGLCCNYLYNGLYMFDILVYYYIVVILLLCDNLKSTVLHYYYTTTYYYYLLHYNNCYDVTLYDYTIQIV